MKRAGTLTLFVFNPVQMSLQEVDGGPDLNLYLNAILSNKRVRLRWLRRWQEIVPMLSRQWAHHFSLVAAGRWPLLGGSRRYLACCFAEGAVLG